MDEFKKQHIKKLDKINRRKTSSSEMQNKGKNSQTNSRVQKSTKNAEMTLSQKREQEFSQPKKLNLEFILFRGKKYTILENEKFLLVYHKESVKKLRKEFPGIAMYSPLEIQEILKRNDGSNEYLEFFKRINSIKREFGGWINIKKWSAVS